MIFSPHNTNELRHRFALMLEGVFRIVQSEIQPIDINNNKLDYFCAYFSSGCIAVIEKWVQSDFAQSKDFIESTLSDLDINMETYMSTELGK